MNRLRSILILATIAGLAVCAFAFNAFELGGLLSLGALGSAFGMRDYLLKVTKTLPAAASTAASSTYIDTGKGSFSDQLADVEFLLTAPALNTTQCPDTRTMTYLIEHDDDSAFGTVATLITNPIVQTGAGGAGAAAATYRFRLPSTAKRYIRAKATTGASMGDCSAASLTLEALL